MRVRRVKIKVFKKLLFDKVSSSYHLCVECFFTFIENWLNNQPSKDGQTISKEFQTYSQKVSKKFLQKIPEIISKNSQKILIRAYKLKSFSSLFGCKINNCSQTTNSQRYSLLRHYVWTLRSLLTCITYGWHQVIYLMYPPS